MAETQQEQEEKQKREQNITAPPLGLGRSGTRVAGQAGKLISQTGARAGTALLTTPAGWVIIGIVIIVVITFIIVFSFGPSPSSTSDQTTSVVPTLTPTPAP